MLDVDICLWHYNRLQQLLEEDLYLVEKAMQGEMLDVYRQVVKKELEQLNKEIRNFKVECSLH